MLGVTRWWNSVVVNAFQIKALRINKTLNQFCEWERVKGGRHNKNVVPLTFSKVQSFELVVHSVKCGKYLCRLSSHHIWIIVIQCDLRHSPELKENWLSQRSL